MKIVAHVLQQKLFGEMMSGNVGVRAMVGVNTDAIKAIRLILSKPGLSLAKVAALREPSPYPEPQPQPPPQPQPEPEPQPQPQP